MNIWVFTLIMIFNAATITINTFSIVNTHKNIKRDARQFLRDGIKLGKLHRYLDIPIPDAYFTDRKTAKMPFVKGFIHGYISTGRGIEREMNRA